MILRLDKCLFYLGVLKWDRVFQFKKTPITDIDILTMKIKP